MNESRNNLSYQLTDVKSVHLYGLKNGNKRLHVQIELMLLILTWFRFKRQKEIFTSFYFSSVTGELPTSRVTPEASLYCKYNEADNVGLKDLRKNLYLRHQSKSATDTIFSISCIIFVFTKFYLEKQSLINPFNPSNFIFELVCCPLQLWRIQILSESGIPTPKGTRKSAMKMKETVTESMFSPIPHPPWTREFPVFT